MMDTSTDLVLASFPPDNPNRTASISESDQHECHVHSLTAKFFLKCPVEDLIPPVFIRQAEQTNIIQHKPWIFGVGFEDGRDVDQSDWSNVDIRYRGVFKALAKVPDFEKGLWDGGCEECEDELNQSNPKSQAQVVYALMEEVTTILDLSRETKRRDATFYLRPHVLPFQLEYWTGFREKHHDAPLTSGCICLDFEPRGRKASIAILPVSTTMQEESLTSCLEGKFKLLLAQLLIHARCLPMAADKIPDQEIFLIGLHGSKLHLMRAYFPGQKLSSIWCRRNVPGPSPILVDETPESLSPPSSTSSPDTAHASHIESINVKIGSQGAIHTKSSVSETPTGVAQQAHTSTHTPGLSRKERFEQARLAALDNELDLHTFRVLGTLEYDLWNPEDFTAAVHIFVALQLYLLSNNARCGVLMDTFRRHPILSYSFTTVNYDCENTTRVTRPDTNKNPDASTKPDTDTKYDNAETETYFDSDSDLSSNELDDEAFYDEFLQLNMDEEQEDEQGPEHRPVEEEVVEQWRSEVTQKCDAEEAECAVEGDQTNSSQDAQERWWDMGWADNEAQWKVLGVFDGQEPEREEKGDI